jgi:hypothetical protein
MRRIGLIAIVLLLALIPGAGARAATQRDAVLGADGELYTVKAGVYGELFPGGKQLPASSSVLALDIVKPDATRTRLLVKGTEAADADESPFLLYEEASRTLFLVWETRLGGVFPILMLSGYDGSWMDPFPIIDYPFSIKASPQLAVTHDSYQEENAAGAVTRHRTVLHLVWGQEADSGDVETYYTPLFFENGALIGRSPSYRLNDFESADANALSAPGATLSEHIARIQRGRDDRTVVVAFSAGGGGNGGRLTTLEIGALPPQLGRIADGARAHIIDLGARLFPGNLQALAASTRTEVIRLGTSFDPEVLKSLADQVEAYIVDKGSSSSATLKVIADGARAHIIDLGAKLTGRGLRNVQSASTSNIVEVKPADLGSGNADIPSQLLQFREVASRVVPEADKSEVKVFFSETGEHVLLAWASGNRILYRESADTGWKDLLEIRLSDSLDEARAYEILDQRVRNH